MGGTIEIPYGKGSIGGYLAETEGSAPFPAVVVLHEWWGLDDHIRDVADRLAAEGFLALAPDLYDGSVTSDEAEAERLMDAHSEEAPKKALAAYDALVARGDVKRIGCMGLSMGGTLALHVAVSQPRLNACVNFYGLPDAYLSRLEAMRCPFLGFFGELDPWVTTEQVGKLDRGLHEATIAHDVIVYPGANHDFLNDRGGAYHAEAAQDAWERTLRFLGEHLR